MLELFVAAIDLAAHPLALVGYLVLGVWARSFLHAIGYAIAWAAAMEVFATVTGSGFADISQLAVRFGLRAVGAIVLTLAIFLLYRALRRGPSGGGGRRGGGGSAPKRPSHLRRIK